MKNTLILIAFFCYFFTFKLNAQTYIGAAIGLDYTNVTSLTSYRQSLEEEYTANSKLFTFIVEQQLTEKWLLSFQNAYTEKEISTLVTYGAFPYPSYYFNNFRSTLTAKWRYVKYSYLGAGLMHNYIFSPTQHLYADFWTEPYKEKIEMDNKREIAAIFQVGVEIKNIFLELNYSRGLGRIGAQKERDLFEPTNYFFGASLGYRLRVFKGRKR